MTTSSRTYLPAAGRDIFLPLYDPLLKILGTERAREQLLAQAGIRPTDRVFDLGCGTGTLAVLIKLRRLAGVRARCRNPERSRGISVSAGRDRRPRSRPEGACPCPQESRA